jgi:holo-[acyl-carrier-protein] synthase
MILGTGIDIVEVDRIRDLIKRYGDRFLMRIFSVSEIGPIHEKVITEQYVAGRFAAKESILKMLGTGWSEGISWQDMEIQTGAHGQPEVILQGKALDLAQEAGIEKVHLSISHTEHYAVAFAVGEGGGETS